MGNKLDDQFLLIQASIDDNNQASDEKMNKYYSALDEIRTLIKQVTVHYQNSLPNNMDSPKSQYHNTVVLGNSKASLLGGGNSKKLVACGLSNMISYHQNSINSLSIKTQS